MEFPEHDDTLIYLADFQIDMEKLKNSKLKRQVEDILGEMEEGKNYEISIQVIEKLE